MRKTILVVLGATLVAATTVQMTAAAEHHRSHKADRAPVSTSQKFRNANANAPLAAQPDWSRYSGGFSAPAGR